MAEDADWFRYHVHRGFGVLSGDGISRLVSKRTTMRDKLLTVIGTAAILLLARDIYLISGLPPEANQGAIFKIIFFHVPMAITALTCAMVAFAASILFLATKNFKYDAMAVAVTEVGLAFLAGN